MEVLDNIPVHIDPKRALTLAGVRRRNALFTEMVEELIDEITPLARPKAVYDACLVDNRHGESMDVGGVTFTSRVVRVNLDDNDRAFPWIATCGTELDEITRSESDPLRQFCLDAIKIVVLGCAVAYLHEHLKVRYEIDQLSHMNPGDLPDWPLTQQRELFSLFGDVESLIGVRLTEGFAMVPTKSSSGIGFASETEFHDCQLCQQEKCVGRRAAYDPEVVRRYAEAEI